MPRNQPPPLILSMVFFLLGLALLAGGGYAEYRSQSKIANFAVAEGEVVQLVGSGKGAKPLVRFHPAPAFGPPPAPGQVEQPMPAVEVLGTVSSSPPAYDIGEKVNVYYDPDDPLNTDKPVIAGFLEQHFVGLILGFIGLVFAGLGSAFIAMRLKGSAASAA